MPAHLVLHLRWNMLQNVFHLKFIPWVVCMNRFSAIFSAFFTLWLAAIHAYALPTLELVPGGLALIALPRSSGTVPIVHFNQRRVMVLPGEKNNQWQALIGIPLTTQPGEHTITVQNDSKVAEPIAFTVNLKNYAVQHITLKNTRKVTPPAQDLKLINNQAAIINRLLARFTQQNSIDTDFIWPVQGRISGGFGLRRIFNHIEKDPHNGIDIAAKKGTPIQAPANGKVINTGNYFYSGNTVFLDHGQGLISLYAHLDSIQVHTGQHITRGTILGTSGQTGRATGPHLHWGIVLNGARVNPSLFIHTPHKLKEEEKIKPVAKKSNSLLGYIHTLSQRIMNARL